MPKTTSQRYPGSRPAVLGSSRSILRGELDKIGLPTLLTILEMERRSGILILQHRRQLGRLYVRDGQVIRASTEGGRRHLGVEAVYAMLGWPEGQFELWQAAVEGRDDIGERTTYLIMEGMRRLDEARSPIRTRGRASSTHPDEGDLDAGALPQDSVEDDVSGAFTISGL